tara:strand:+ start:1446 stop:1745 length:300 start_codon:yes stop_codon:yes gene_type:complete
MNSMYILLIIIYFLLLPIFFGAYEFFIGTKFIHTKERKKEELKRHLKLIKDGYIIQGFPHNGWSVSYYPSSNDKWFYPKMYSFVYKWAVYYRFKWFNMC